MRWRSTWKPVTCDNVLPQTTILLEPEIKLSGGVKVAMAEDIWKLVSWIIMSCV